MQTVGMRQLRIDHIDSVIPKYRGHFMARENTDRHRFWTIPYSFSHGFMVPAAPCDRADYQLRLE